MDTAQGLLLALSTAPPGRENDYHAWYDEEHAPERLEVEGFRTARRYRDMMASQGYLAYYDLDSVDVLDSDAYRALAPNASAREREILAAIPAIDRRVYAAVPAPEVSCADDAAVCGDVLLAVWWSPAPGTEDDFNAWYTQEHIPLLMKVPGWLRVRRYAVVDGGGPRYLALHDLASERSLEAPERDAVNTPWRARVVENRREHERRVFRLWRRFD